VDSGVDITTEIPGSVGLPLLLMVYLVIRINQAVVNCVFVRICFLYGEPIWLCIDLCYRSEERRVGKSVDLGGRRIIKKKK